jgi:hypothetical protein
MAKNRFRLTDTHEWQIEERDLRAMRECVPAYSLPRRMASGRETIVIQPSDMAQIIAKDREIANLERELKQYRENCTGQATDLILRVVGITTDIFGKDVRVSQSYDPEFAKDKFVVLTVETELSPAEIVEAEQRWIQQVFKVNPHWEQLRLLVFPK